MSSIPQLDPRDAALADAVAERVTAKLNAGLLLTATDAARYIGIGRDAFYGLLDEPGFPKPVRVKGGGKRYLRRELEAWAASRPRAKRAAIRVEQDDTPNGNGSP